MPLVVQFSAVNHVVVRFAVNALQICEEKNYFLSFRGKCVKPCTADAVALCAAAHLSKLHYILAFFDRENITYLHKSVLLS